MTSHHAGYPGYQHEQHGGRLDAETLGRLYEAQAILHDTIGLAREQLHNLQDHDTNAEFSWQGFMQSIAITAEAICTMLEHHTDLSVYAVCWGLSSHHMHDLLAQWHTELQHGGAAALQHPVEEFLSTFQHNFDAAVAEL
jgi:hypothetical protein